MTNCSNLSYQPLRKIKDNYLKKKTLKAACDIIINSANKLPIQELYNINNTINSSIDGKKYNTNENVFNPRFLKKYLFEKGMSVLKLIANLLTIELRIISLNKYEEIFRLQILLFNSFDIKPQVNFTNMRNINKLNHAVYDFVGYGFQSRYNDIYTQASKFYCFRELSDYTKDYIIQKFKQINKKLTLEKKLNMKRIAALIKNIRENYVKMQCKTIELKAMSLQSVIFVIS